MKSQINILYEYRARLGYWDPRLATVVDIVAVQRVFVMNRPDGVQVRGCGC